MASIMAIIKATKRTLNIGGAVKHKNRLDPRDMANQGLTFLSSTFSFALGSFQAHLPHNPIQGARRA